MAVRSSLTGDNVAVIRHLPQGVEDRLHVLSLKHSGDTLTPTERVEFEALVEQAQRLMVANARALSRAAGPSVGQEASRATRIGTSRSTASSSR